MSPRDLCPRCESVVGDLGLDEEWRRMRVLVTGSRSWQDQASVWSALDALACRGQQVTVVHGDCPQGADALPLAG